MAGRARPVAPKPPRAPKAPKPSPTPKAPPRARGTRPAAPSSDARWTVGAVAVVALLVGAAATLSYLRTPHRGQGAIVRITVDEDASAGSITRALWDAHAIDRPWLFHLFAALGGAASSAHRGTVALRDDLSPVAILRTLRRGSAGLVRVTIPEGFTRFAIARRLETSGVCAARDFLAATEDPSAVRAAGAEGSLEGWLFPDTYDLPPDSPAGRVVERMTEAFARRFADVAAAHPEGMTRAADFAGGDERAARRAVITVASLVERETGAPEDRAHVASVFWNRLTLDDFRPKLLQSDPTVTYGCAFMAARVSPLPSCEDGAARHAITAAMLLDRENPYNTYAHEGLPPTPVANPGVRALEAALTRTHDEDVYFVARGDGRSAFAATLEDHRRNVRRWLRRGDAGALSP